MSPQGEHAKRDAAARRAAAEQEFTDWLDRQANPPHRQAWTESLLAGLEAEAVAEAQRRAARAQANRDRRDAGYGY